MIAALWHAGWHEAHDLLCDPALVALRNIAEFRERLTHLIPNTHVLVTNDGIAGFAMVTGAELYQLYVAPDVRGTGAADRLMQKCEDLIAANGISTGFLHCTIGNARAASFYRRSGWALARTEAANVVTSAGPFDMILWRFEKHLR